MQKIEFPIKSVERTIIDEYSQTLFIDNAGRELDAFEIVQVLNSMPSAESVIKKAWDALTCDELLKKVPEIGLKAQQEAENAGASSYAVSLLSQSPLSKDLTLEVWAQAMREGFTRLLVDASKKT